MGSARVQIGLVAPRAYSCAIYLCHPICTEYKSTLKKRFEVLFAHNLNRPIQCTPGGICQPGDPPPALVRPSLAGTTPSFRNVHFIPRCHEIKTAQINRYSHQAFGLIVQSSCVSIGSRGSYVQHIRDSSAFCNKLSRQALLVATAVR